jgi:hypothetical protein
VLQFVECQSILRIAAIPSGRPASHAQFSAGTWPMKVSGVESFREEVPSNAASLVADRIGA